jgi:hypothetical protein
MTEFVPSRKGPNYQESVEGAFEQRVVVEPHTVMEGLTLRTVYPSSGMKMSKLMEEGATDFHPVVRMDHANLPLSLAFIPTAPELHTMIEVLTAMVGEMEAAADAMLARTLAKKGGEQ